MPSDQTSILAREALDRDRMAVRISVQQIINLLYDYIPRACIHEVEDKLFDNFFIAGIELTSNTMRKEYEEWKKLELNSMMLQPRPKVQP